MRVLSLTGLFILLALGACGGGDDPEPEVTPDPNAPVLQSIGNQSVVAGSNLNFQILADNPSSESLSYSSTPSSFYSRPSTPVFSGRSFNWDPSTNDVGTHSVTFTAENSPSGLQDSETISITVTSATASTGETLFNANCTGSSCHTGTQACVPWVEAEIIDALPGGMFAVSAMSGVSVTSNQITEIATYAGIAFQSGCP
jgi:hypothetical protein